MLIRFLLIVFCLSMMIASAKADINKGVEYYQKRQEGSKGTLASVENILTTYAVPLLLYIILSIFISPIN